MKKILMINGHPYEDKLGYLLHRNYKEGALQAGHEVKEILLKDTHFSLNLERGYKALPESEADISNAQEAISWSDHIVWIYPNWWGTYPALLKGFIDRVFLPGFAFRYENGKGLIKLLKGKSSGIIVSMDNPVWYYRWIIGAPGHKAMKRAILHFCGIAPVSFFAIGQVRKANENRIQRWTKKAYSLGQKAQ